MQRKRWCAAGGRALSWIALSWMLATGVQAQGVSTTTVQGTVYLANGQPGAGTLVVKWPAFTTAAGQAIVAGSTTVGIPADGYVSLNLAPNQGATPAGEYYTAIFDLSDGSTHTEYWVIPAAAQATLAQVRAQVMPAAQAVQAASKAYVDQSIAELNGSFLTSSGGNLTGPLYLNGDPGQPLQAATKHYVDSQFAEAVPLTGGTLTGPLTATRLGAAWQVDQFPGADFGVRLQACVDALDPAYGGTCDARNFSGAQSMSSNLVIQTGNTTVLLPCATISTASQIVVPVGVRNVALRGCAQRGGSASSGSTGGTAIAYSGAAAMVQVGDPTYAADTSGFHMDNLVINTTPATNATAQAFAAYRTQELDIESLYLLGNANQTGMTLDGTGNYTGGTFLDDQVSGFQTAVHGLGHQVANSATTDWLNASTFVRLHVDCPTSSGSPVAGTIGVDLQQGDGNTFTGGDVEGCATAVHLGANAQNNTIVGLRNENSNQQVVADAGSAYNSWITGGTMYTGQLTDNGTRNSFMDTFHRSFNELNGDWYGSQQDATVTNHFRLGIGTGNERGLLNRYQTDSGYRWTTGLSDATAGEQFYQVQDELNHVYRISIGQYNSGQPNTNNQTVLNSAGTGAVVLNGSNGSGTGGVIFGSGGPSESTVATVDQGGNAQFNGALQVGGTSQSTGTMTVRNNADAEVDYYLWPGLTASQKGAFTYKDWNGASQWYMVKDQNNNWALNSALGGLDSFKAYQSTNSGDTYINASNPSGVVRVNYETGSGGGFKVYGGNSSTLYASFTGAAAIAFPGLAASSGHNCLQIDSSGYITNTGAGCGPGAGVSGAVDVSTSGYIAYYDGDGATIGGISSVPLTAGGTGATTAAGALANLGALPVAGGTLSGALHGTSAAFSDTLTAGTTTAAILLGIPGVDPTGTNDSGGAINAALNALTVGGRITLLPGTYKITTPVVIPTGVELDFAPGAKMEPGAASTAILSIDRGGWANNLFIDTGNISGYSGCAVTAVGSPSGNQLLWGLGGTWRLRSGDMGASGTGLCMNSTSSSNYITYFWTGKGSIGNFATGVSISATGSGWVNDNFLDLTTMCNATDISINGGGGNTITGGTQATTFSVHAISVRGAAGNTFNYAINDWGSSGSLSPFAVLMGEGSSQNVLNIPLTTRAQVADYGSENIINTQASTTNSQQGTTLDGMSFLPASKFGSNLGNQDDYLAFLTIRPGGGTITSSPNASPDAGVYSTLFQPGFGGNITPVTWNYSTLSAAAQTLTITLPALSAIGSLNLQFNAATQVPNGIAIQVSSDGVTYYPFKTYVAAASSGGASFTANGTESETSKVTGGTYTSGGTFSGTGTCSLSFVSSAGALATATLAVPVSVGEVLSITNGGIGYTYPPTSATVTGCTSGATGSGTVAVSTTYLNAGRSVQYINLRVPRSEGMRIKRPIVFPRFWIGPALIE
jgi:hypothetical protein